MTKGHMDYVVYKKGREVIAIPNQENLIVALLEDGYSFESFLGERHEDDLVANPPRLKAGLRVNRVYRVLDEDDGWQDYHDLGTGGDNGGA